MNIGLPMRSVVLFGSIGFLILLVSSGDWLADRLAIREPDSMLESRLEAFIRQEMVDKRIPGLSISIVADQNTLMEAGYGMANPESSTPASPYTVYRGGSLAQIFTTIAVLQRVELHKIDLDAPISEYLPRFMPYNPYGLPLTLRQILSHQSGLVSEPPLGHTYDNSSPTLAETVNSINQTTIVYPPETFTKYSNAGFAVAGHLLETMLEKPFEQHMRAILDRMYLKRTSFTSRFDLKNKLATGHIYTFDSRRMETPVFELGNAPAADIYTTASDLGAFLKVLFADGLSPNGRILDAESFEQMWTVQLSTARRQLPYALGFAMSVFENERRASLSSSMHGFSGRLDLLPDRDLGIAILANSEQADVALERIAQYAFQLLSAQAEERPAPYPPLHPAPDEPTRSRAIGYYAGNPSLTISEAGDELYLYRDLSRFRLRQSGDSLIVDDPYRYGPILIVDGVTLFFEQQLYQKRGNPVYTPAPTHFEELRGFYGPVEYPLYITDHNGRLFGIKNYRKLYALNETARDTFSLPDDGMYGGEQLIFLRDEAGQITGAEFGNMVLPRQSLNNELFAYSTLPLIEKVSANMSPAVSTQPVELPAQMPSELVDLALIDPLLNIDMPLASPDNIFGEQIYGEARALLQKPLAEALFRIQREIRRRGFELIIYDAYRPWHISKAIWESVPDSLKFFFDDPDEGPCQNRGAAVSLGFFELATSERLPMPTDYGIFSSHTFADSPLPDSRLRWNRDVLRRTMETEGFRVSPTKWWHFIHESCEAYPIINEPFSQIDQQGMLRQQRIFTID